MHVDTTPIKLPRDPAEDAHKDALEQLAGAAELMNRLATPDRSVIEELLRPLADTLAAVESRVPPDR